MYIGMLCIFREEDAETEPAWRKEKKNPENVNGCSMAKENMRAVGGRRKEVDKQLWRIEMGTPIQEGEREQN